ncbi:class D beta-lactamase [Colwelliaceae bacterium 6471]
MKSLILFIFSVLSLVCTTLHADDDISSLVNQHKLDATVIITSLNRDIEYIHNPKRLHQRFFPASTFKLFNTLVALEEKVISNEHEIIKWDGKDRGWEQWNKDQTLASALAYSCVWCYQKFAQVIGDKKYHHYFKLIGYGNNKTGEDITTFWLQGDLAISANEQIDFLIKLYNEQLPFAPKNMQRLKKIMTVEQTDDYVLKAKTGWSNDIGWYVGYIETNTQPYFFATNMKINHKSELALRKQIIIESLRAKGIILVTEPHQ